MDWSSTLAFLGFLAVVMLTASSGALFPPDDWYRRLPKPSWTPPNWVFAPAWTLLYILIAVAAWLVWRRAGLAGAAGPLALWLLNLVLNAAWSWLFFGRKRIDWALAEVVALWLSVLAVILAFAPISATAAWLLLPYLAWVGFAGVLNWAIWRLNRQAVAA